MSRAKPTSMFARLPIGRSAGVRLLWVASALLAAGCVFWIRELRLAGDPGGLAPIFFVLFAFYDYTAAMCALAILLVAIFVPGWRGFDVLLGALGRHPVRLAVATTALLGAGTLLVYRNQPLSMDEYAAYFQSQVFASGHLAGRYPVDLLDHLVPQGFQNFFLTTSHVTGEVASKYWPSFALIMTPFTVLGIAWACNAVLSGLTLIVLNRLALRLFASVEAAGLVTLLTIASPVFFADGISYYSMTSHLLANALFALLVIEPSTRRLVAAGVVGSIALTLHNPVPHLLFALPWFVWLVRQERGWSKVATLCAGYLPLSLLLGVGWFAFSGRLANAAGGQAADVGTLGNVADAFAWPTARLWYARLVGLAKLMLWASPGVVVLMFAGAWKTRRDSRFVALAMSALLTFVGYLFVWADQGHGWGFRYFHSAWLALPLFAAAALHAPAPGAKAMAAATPSAQPALADLRTYVVACAILSVVAGNALRAVQMQSFMDRHLRQQPDYAGREPRVIVVSGVGFYAYDLVQNDPFLRSDVVRMIDLGEPATSAAILRRFPGYRLVHRDDFGQIWSAAGGAAP